LDIFLDSCDMLPLISVIIPTYNRSFFVNDAIQSILSQDRNCFHLDIIVIDDGSTDDTKNVLAKYVDNNSIRYIYQENKGAGAARNKGIALAKGDWITFLDSDDRWFPSHISLQLAVINKIPNCKVLFSDFMISKDYQLLKGSGLDCWAKAISEINDGEWKKIFPDKFNSMKIGLTHNGAPFDIYRGHIFNTILFQPCMPCWTTMVSRDCLTDGIRFAEHLPTWEDVWFSCLLAEKNEIYYIDIATAENRGHSGPRLTQANYAVRTKCHLQICSDIFIKSNSPNRPADAILIGFYTKLIKRLFVETIKKNIPSEMKNADRELFQMGITSLDLPFLIIYYISKLPGNLLNKIARFKRLFMR
jgi:glycosyltransferase involved in cell wall biosynthesis